MASPRQHSQWDAAKQAAYEAFRQSRSSAIRPCTCGMAEADRNAHAPTCPYWRSVQRIDAAWYAQQDKEAAR